MGAFGKKSNPSLDCWGLESLLTVSEFPGECSNQSILIVLGPFETMNHHQQNPAGLASGTTGCLHVFSDIYYIYKIMFLRF